ncbi:MAG: hypothetical protein J6P58_05390 [Oscillospiraceae bacterium]|nr:hypothetical protein [Oscillospiraceae bacterium]
MYTPHTVSLINDHHTTPHLTVLHGVMLQALHGRSVQRRGNIDEANATLYVPLSVRAVNEAGERVSFPPPMEYLHCSDPEKHWTLQPEGESAGRCSFFVKGELTEPCTLAEARERYDDVFIVAGWQVHDYGSRALWHYEIVSRVSSRYYQHGD